MAWKGAWKGALGIMAHFMRHACCSLPARSLCVAHSSEDRVLTTPIRHGPHTTFVSYATTGPLSKEKSASMPKIKLGIFTEQHRPHYQIHDVVQPNMILACAKLETNTPARAANQSALSLKPTHITALPFTRIPDSRTMQLQRPRPRCCARM